MVMGGLIGLLAPQISTHTRLFCIVTLTICGFSLNLEEFTNMNENKWEKSEVDKIFHLVQGWALYRKWKDKEADLIENIK